MCSICPPQVQGIPALGAFTAECGGAPFNRTLGQALMRDVTGNGLHTPCVAAVMLWGLARMDPEAGQLQTNQ